MAKKRQNYCKHNKASSTCNQISMSLAVTSDLTPLDLLLYFAKTLLLFSQKQKTSEFTSPPTLHLLCFDFALTLHPHNNVNVEHSHWINSAHNARYKLYNQQ